MKRICFTALALLLGAISFAFSIQLLKTVSNSEEALFEGANTVTFTAEGGSADVLDCRDPPGGRIAFRARRNGSTPAGRTSSHFLFASRPSKVRGAERVYKSQSIRNRMAISPKTILLHGLKRLTGNRLLSSSTDSPASRHRRALCLGQSVTPC